MNDFRGGPELPSSETLTSLVEDDKIRISGLIESDFTLPNSAETRSLSQAGALLESQLLPVVFAAKDLGYIQDRTRYVMDARMGNKYGFMKEQLHAINSHSFIRTLALSEIVQVINVSGDMIHKAVKELEIEPAMPAGIIDSSYYYMNTDRYNKDQIVALHSFLKDRMTPPSDAIAEEKIIKVTNISGEALRDIKHALGTSSTWYKDPEDGEGKPYVAPDDALKILKYIKDPEYRRSFRDS